MSQQLVKVKRGRAGRLSDLRHRLASNGEQEALGCNAAEDGEVMDLPHVVMARSA